MLYMIGKGNNILLYSLNYREFLTFVHAKDVEQRSQTFLVWDFLVLQTGWQQWRGRGQFCASGRHTHVRATPFVQVVGMCTCTWTSLCAKEGCVHPPLEQIELYMCTCTPTAYTNGVLPTRLLLVQVVIVIVRFGLGQPQSVHDRSLCLFLQFSCTTLCQALFLFILPGRFFMY